MPPLALSDAELDAIIAACRPIPIERRDAFMHAVAEALAKSGETVGPGSVARAIKSVQQRFVHVAVGRSPIGTRKYG